MTSQILLALTILIPLGGAALIPLFRNNPNVREGVSLATAAILFLANLALIPTVTDGGRPVIEILPFLPGAALVLSAEPLALLFGLVASGLWFVTTIYAIGYMRGHGEENQTRFYAFFAIALAATMAVAYSGNLMTMFVAYEALSLSTYPLVTHAGTEAAKRGGRTYLGILIGTSIGFFLLAILWTWTVAGTLDFTPGGILGGKAETLTLLGLLALFVFGIAKAGVMPFHRWLPAAMVAPTPVSALLHAVAVVKAGVFAIVKIAVYIFGIDTLAEMGTSQIFMYVAAFTILAASIVALRQDNLKKRLAYSTVSQLSYIVLGAMIASSLGIVGGGMQIAAHAFGKITLFFCAGAIIVAAHKTEVSQMAGLGKKMPLTFIFFFIGALSIIGLPPTGGMWSKWYLALATLEAENYLLLGVLMTSSLLAIGYLMPVIVQGFFATSKDSDGGSGAEINGASTEIKEAPWPLLLAMGSASALCIILFFIPGPVIALMEMIFTG